MSNNRPLTVKERQARLAAQFAQNAEYQSTLAEVGRLNLSRWERLTTEDGQVYYHDKQTGKTQWEEPEPEPAEATVAVTPVPEGLALLPLPPGWQQLIETKEDGTEVPYYYHKMSGITTYDFPTLPEGWSAETNNDGDAYYYVPERNNIPSQYPFPTQTTLANINANRARRGNAATRIQKTARGALGRKTAKAVKAAKKAQNASRKIQSLFRGHRNRKTVRAMKTAKAAVNAATRAAEEAAQAAANATGSAAADPMSMLQAQFPALRLDESDRAKWETEFNKISPSDQLRIVNILKTGTAADKKNIVRIRKSAPQGSGISCKKSGVCTTIDTPTGKTVVITEENRYQYGIRYGYLPGEIMLPYEGRYTEGLVANSSYFKHGLQNSNNE
jgi:hypothetical protein